MNKTFAVVPLALLLAACGDLETPDCGMPASAPTADTVFSFQVDGRQILQGTGGYYPHLGEDSTYGFADLTALVESGTKYEWLSIRLTHFVGTGAYPVFGNYQEYPFAWVTYYCSEVPGWYWTGAPEWGDTVYVTAFDTLTRQFEASFSARLTGNHPGQYLDITGGSIRGTLTE